MNELPVQPTVAELLPGDEISQLDTSAVYIAQATHPLYPGLQLVIWRMPDGSWSHDALRASQVAGTAADRSYDARHARLRAALLHASQL